MIYLIAENVSKSYGERVLFSGLSLTIEKGQKIALVAKNGAGKSSLLKILTGIESAEGGMVRVTKDIRMGYLPQEPELDVTKTILECVLSGDSDMLKAIALYEDATEKYAEADTPQHMKLLEHAMMEVDRLQAWDHEQKVKLILTKLGITKLAQKVSTLSGGQRKRVALAKVLIEEPDLLLIDEPTNHLDMEMIEWLEDYLKRSALALLLVTHDRYFLDRITNQILELDNGQLYKYIGNYQNFLEKKEERENLEAMEVGKARNLMRKELEWMRRQPKARTTKSKSRISAFYDLKDKAAGKLKEDGMELNVQMQRLGGKILECHNITKKFDELTILDDFSYMFQKGERLGIVGQNGVGKTTFLELLTGKIKPDSGFIDTGETVVFGYYTQAGLKMPEEKRVIEVVTDIADVIPLGNGEVLTAAKLLEQFGFEPARQYTFVSKLSGGERRRLHLLTILIKNPNFLILDEPTNDLDLPTLQTLEDFLLNFKGCLIIVTHDRYFLDKLAQHLFIFEGQGVVKDFNGVYTEYRDMLDEEERAKKDGLKTGNQGKTAAIENVAPVQKRKLSYKEKREYEGLEAEIEKFENLKTSIEAKMNAGQGSPQDFAKWGQEIQQIQNKIEEKTMRWMELGEFYEA